MLVKTMSTVCTLLICSIRGGKTDVRNRRGVDDGIWNHFRRCDEAIPLAANMGLRWCFFFRLSNHFFEENQMASCSLRKMGLFHDSMCGRCCWLLHRPL